MPSRHTSSRLNLKRLELLLLKTNLIFVCKLGQNQHFFSYIKKMMYRNGNYNWPPRSCNLTLLDFFLWGYLRNKVYADAPQSIQKLKENIRVAIDEIEPQMCENVMGNFMKRAWSRKRSRGDHINDIVFCY